MLREPRDPGEILEEIQHAGEHVQRALISAFAEPGDPTISRLIHEAGPLATIRRVLSHDEDPELRARFFDRLVRTQPSDDLDDVRRLGGRVVIPSDPDWPSQLNDLGLAAPWLLWVRGLPNLRLSLLRSVAVVGARASTPYGDRVASEFAADRKSVV